MSTYIGLLSTTDNRVAILFVWDGDWDCGLMDNKWVFTGKKCKTVLLPMETTFAQLRDKAYSVSNICQKDFVIDMTSWFAYDKIVLIPPCPIQDDDDVRVLLHDN